MKDLIYIAAVVAVLSLGFAICGQSARAEDDEPPVKLLFKCGTMRGQGELMVSLNGEVERYTVQCPAGQPM